MPEPQTARDIAEFVTRLRAQARDGDAQAYRTLYALGVQLDASRPVDPLVTFGFEAEFFGISARAAVNLLREGGFAAEDDGYNHRVQQYWRVTHDSSVNAEGNELVSPILRLGKTHLREMRKVTRLLRDNGGQVDRSCGLHVHHNAERLELDDVCQMVGTWALFQPIIHTILPKSRIGAVYARPLYDPLHWMDWIRRQGSMQMLRGASGDAVGRYHAVNLHALRAHNTIEFRQHSGTLNAKKIDSWIRLTKQFILVGRTRGYDGCERLIAEYGSEDAVRNELGLAGMLAHLGCSEDLAGYYLRRHKMLSGDKDKEDLDANYNPEQDRHQMQDGESNPQGTARWCRFHQEWHPFDGRSTWYRHTEAGDQPVMTDVWGNVIPETEEDLDDEDNPYRPEDY